MIVAIDGPAGVGKSTIAKAIAQRCALQFVNSGSFYRAITFRLQQEGTDLYDENLIVGRASEIRFDFSKGHLYADGEDLEEYLHTDAVDAHVARISAFPRVREVVNKALRLVARDHDIIMEGRDITTVVFPDAELKFYFDASIEIRAKRRYKQQDTAFSLEQIEKEIIKRDLIDTTKEVGALKVSPDAEYIDTSYLTIDAVCEKVVKKIEAFRKIKDQES